MEETEKMSVVKEHWLHGKIKFHVDVKEEDDCCKCVHLRVCKMDKESFCLNYNFGTSQGKTGTCQTCIHRHTRKVWREKDGFPCFKCRYFAKGN